MEISISQIDELLTMREMYKKRNDDNSKAKYEVLQEVLEIMEIVNKL